jgi:hypothetical protein
VIVGSIEKRTKAVRSKQLKLTYKNCKKGLFSIEKANISIEKTDISIEKANISIEKPDISIEKASRNYRNKAAKSTKK